MVATLNSTHSFRQTDARFGRIANSVGKPSSGCSQSCLVGGGSHPESEMARFVLLVMVALVVLVALVVSLRVSQTTSFSQRSPVVGPSSLVNIRPSAAGDAKVVVARPGDTMWGIVSDAFPGEDPRPLVDVLAEINGSTSVDVGQPIVIPGNLVQGNS